MIFFFLLLLIINLFFILDWRGKAEIERSWGFEEVAKIAIRRFWEAEIIFLRTVKATRIILLGKTE